MSPQPDLHAVAANLPSGRLAAVLLQRFFEEVAIGRQKVDVRPNYRLPASQGPQDTQGRDKSYGVPMNPYEQPPITDWKEKTTP